MTTSSLPISRLINVAVNLTPSGALAQNLSTLLILGSSPVIDTVSRMRSYSTIAAVAADFGTTAPEYLAAVLWFEQAPQPNNLLIGRWAQTATSGQLIGSVRSAAQQAIAVWNAITSGGFKVTIDGGSVQNVAGLNFGSVTNLNGVASAINAVMTGATCAWNATYGEFVFTSNTTGATSQVSFLTSPTSGTDISSMLGGTTANSGAYASAGIAAESAISAATLFDNTFGQAWYALMVCGAADADHLAIAAYIQAANNKHLYGVTTSEGAILTSGDTTNIAYKLQQLGYTRSPVQYSSSNPYAVASLFGRLLTVNYTGNATVITLDYKQEPGIVAETVNATQIANLESYGCNVFVAYNNNTAIIEPGQAPNGTFLDIITGTDWLALTIQTAIYNLLYTSLTKIPQTDQGAHLIQTTIEAVLSQGVANGLLAPGIWNSAGFGNINQGDLLPKGYYVYIQPMALQAQNLRAQRICPPIQIAAKLAGAVQTASVTINVNQ